MSVSLPSSPYQAATGPASTSRTNGHSGNAGAYDSKVTTPALTASCGPTPELLTRVVTPQDELDGFDLPPAAIDLDDSAKEAGTVPAASPTTLKSQVRQATPAKEGKVPECWGHRGASATYPENTKASFVEACKQGADGIETDIFYTADDELVLFHDPDLGHKTDGHGKIRDLPWTGVIEHVRTTAQPAQPLARFRDICEILLAEGNEHVKLNLDCKVDNDADRLFTLIGAALASIPGWKETLAPRIVLGLWHPKFVLPAVTHLPFLPRYAISMSPSDARSYFWPAVHGFSMYYSALARPAGQAFLAECKAADKAVCAWTVNGEEQMRECARWGVDSVISDKPALWRKVKSQILADRKRALRPTLTTYVLPWVTKTSWSLHIAREARIEMEYLEKEGGPFGDWPVQPGVSDVL